MTREQMLDVRHKADHRDQPDALFHGQRIIGYSEWKGGDLYTSGRWSAVVFLADGARILIEEE